MPCSSSRMPAAQHRGHKAGGVRLRGWRSLRSITQSTISWTMNPKSWASTTYTSKLVTWLLAGSFLQQLQALTPTVLLVLEVEWGSGSLSPHTPLSQFQEFQSHTLPYALLKMKLPNRNSDVFHLCPDGSGLSLRGRHVSNLLMISTHP